MSTDQNTEAMDAAMAFLIDRVAESPAFQQLQAAEEALKERDQKIELLERQRDALLAALERLTRHVGMVQQNGMPGSVAAQVYEAMRLARSA